MSVPVLCYKNSQRKAIRRPALYQRCKAPPGESQRGSEINFGFQPDDGKHGDRQKPEMAGVKFSWWGTVTPVLGAIIEHANLKVVLKVLIAP